ncbi:MAG: hypothetical protein V1810_03885 [Candidatus Beckwithbacteria bacterium]
MNLENEVLLPQPEVIKQERAEQLVIGGEFCGVSEVNKLLGKLGFTTVSAGKLLNIFDSDELVQSVIRYPRNEFVQLGRTIIVRVDIAPSVLKNELTLRLKQMNKNSEKLTVVRDEILGNGGQFMAESGLIIGPEIYFDERVNKVLDTTDCHDWKRVALPTPSMNDYYSWLNSQRSKKYFQELGEKLSETEVTYLKNYYNQKSLGKYPDLDLFANIGTDNQVRPRVLLDDLYAEIYPVAEERVTSHNVTVHRISAWEANRFLADNFLSLGRSAAGRVVFVSEGSTETQQLLREELNYKEIVGGQLDLVVDRQHGAGWHCRFNVIDLSVFK